MDYHISPNGTFTDSKEYRGIVPECTNVGVGYQHQHGPDEFLDYAHAYALRTALLKVQWDKLPVVRKAEIEVPAYDRNWSQRDVFGSGFAFEKYNQTCEDRAWLDKQPTKAKAQPKPKAKALPYVESESVLEDIMTGNADDIMYLIEAEPEIAKDTILKLAMEVAALRGQNAFLRQMLGDGR
jgi:hypothetical protein